MRLLVTHDPLDAYALADRVVVLEAGRSCRPARSPRSTARPRSRYVADLVGLNLVAGDRRDHELVTADGVIVVAADGRDPSPDGPALAAIRPQAITLHRTRPEGSARNVWRLTIDDVDSVTTAPVSASAARSTLVAEITPAAVADLALRVGDDVWASVKATDVDVYAR